jgi:hypothetical protein
MAGLDPANQDLLLGDSAKDVDARHKAGQDGARITTGFICR